MYEKMVQIDQNAPTEEEHRLKGVTKPRLVPLCCVASDFFFCEAGRYKKREHDDTIFRVEKFCPEDGGIMFL